ncbi:MAG: delta-60 repeat domain-containing protein, partial [bacterium]
GGSFSTVGGVNCKSIAHLGPNGALDSTFVNTTGFGLANSATVDDIARQADGRILLVGAFSSYAGSARRGVLRILPSGALDSSFSPGTGAASGIADVVLLPDGKLLLGGGFESFD